MLGRGCPFNIIELFSAVIGIRLPPPYSNAMAYMCLSDVGRESGECCAACPGAVKPEPTWSRRISLRKALVSILNL